MENELGVSPTLCCRDSPDLSRREKERAETRTAAAGGEPRMRVDGMDEEETGEALADLQIIRAQRDLRVTL